MDLRWVRCALAIVMLGLGGLGQGLAVAPSASGGMRRPEPSQVLPLDQLAPEHREAVAEVIRDCTFHRRSEPDTFPCHPRVYESLLDEPALTLALWQDLSAPPAAITLRQIGPNRYQGTNGAGATATGEFVHQSPRRRVALCDFDCVTPRGNARLSGRIVLIVRFGYYREVNGEPWIRHDIEAFVKIDTRGLKTLARTVRPIIEHYLDEQVQEAGWFLSLMGRLVELYPSWACQVAAGQTQVPNEVRQNFLEVLVQTRRPNALPGRPTMADNASEKTRR